MNTESPASAPGTNFNAEPATPPGVLLVDDEASILSALRRLLRPAGYRIFTAEGGKAGLEILAQEPGIVLVISDMRMPEMDGAAFLEQVRTRWPQVTRILLTGYADITSTVNAINKGEIYRYIAKPWDDHDLQLIVRDAINQQQLKAENQRLLELTQRQNAELRELNVGLEAKVAERTGEVRQTMEFLELAHKDLKLGFLHTVKALGSLQEMRGGVLAGHARRVAELARAVGARMTLTDQQASDLFLAALLHDIGKIGLPDKLLDKSFNAMDADERGAVMKHPAAGQAVVMSIEQLKGAGEIIRHHHERFDGQGYPDGLAGLSVPLPARILAVANDYDALQLGTLVSKPCSPEEARDYLIENRGKRYDPEVVDHLAAVLGEQPREAFKEEQLRLMHAKPTMVLTRDLRHPQGYMLLAKGSVLDQHVIGELKRLEEREGIRLTLSVVKNA